ncbi:MAG: anaerobic sulfatase maturase [Phycisphaerales bacterium]|nr:MAG: anaerobic sulfatase maturase [Phycisphaerales bacterium]
MTTQTGSLSWGDQPPSPKRRYHAMVKPIGATCNLDCTYCYYLHKNELLGHQAPKMSDEVLEEHIRQYIESQEGEEIVFSWQGGEPTLLGLDYFRKIIALQDRYRPKDQRIENDLQTNGTLIDEDWCRFLRKHKFLVGLSIDGPRELHDCYRVTTGGKPTFDRVFAAAKLLRRFGVKFNTLSVINRENARHPLEVYRFLSRDVRPDRLQFIPCVEPKDFEHVAPQQWDPETLPAIGTEQALPGGIVTDWSVDPNDWGGFLCVIFDEWYKRDIGRVFVNIFESCAAQWLGMDAQMCVHHEFCGKGVAIEHDGSVYSCDHYVYPEYRLGNITEQPIGDMIFSRRQMDFGFAKRDALPQWCRQCTYRFACNGECPKNRLLRSPDGEVGVNYLCPGFKRFFAHIDDRMREMAARIRAGDEARPQSRKQHSYKRRRRARSK